MVNWVKPRLSLFRSKFRILFTIILVSCVFILQHFVGYSTTPPRAISSILFRSLSATAREDLARKTVGYFYEDDFNSGLYNPLKGYINPCWYESIDSGPPPLQNAYLTHLLPHRLALRRQLDKINSTLVKRKSNGYVTRMRCIPGFYLAGIYKGGTTDLYGSLIQHPLIRPGLLKEPSWHYLNAEKNRRIGFRDYIGLFDSVAMEIEGKASKGKVNPYLTFDATTGLIHMYRSWKQLLWNSNATEPLLSIADHLKVINPHAKIIFMLRQPSAWIESCYDYYHNIQHKYDNLTNVDIHDFLTRDISAFSDCLHKGGTLLECIYNNNDDLCSILNSVYYVPLKTWIDAFGREQVLVIRSELYYSDRLSVMKRIFKFLNIRNPGKKYSSSIQTMKVRNKGQHKLRLFGETKQLVDRFTREWNVRLAEYLEDDGYLDW